MKKKIYEFKRSVRKILKIIFLLGLREIYCWLKNIYGMMEHPSLTVSRIKKREDLSQEILVLGLPWFLWLGWGIVLAVSRIFIFGRWQFGWLAKTSFWGVSFLSLFCFLVFLYFFYEGGRRRRWNE